jgi:hypothetical protein
MEQDRCLALIPVLTTLRISHNELFVISLGSACHEGFLNHCLGQMITHNLCKNVLQLHSGEIFKKSILIIDNDFNSYNLDLLVQRLDKLGISNVEVSTRTTDGIKRFKIEVEDLHLRIICYKSNFPIFFPGRLNHLNEGITEQSIDNFYSDLGVFLKMVEERGGSCILMNFVKFVRAPRASQEWYTDRLLQKYLCRIFPKTPLYKKYVQGEHRERISRVLLSWIGYNSDYKEFEKCLYEPIDGLDRGLDSSVNLQEIPVYPMGRFFFPFTDDFDVSSAEHQLENEASRFRQFTRDNINTTEYYTFQQLYLDINRENTEIKCSEIHQV